MALSAPYLGPPIISSNERLGFAGPAKPKSGIGSDASTAEEDLWQVDELLEERRVSGSAASTSATSHPSKGQLLPIKLTEKESRRMEERKDQLCKKCIRSD